MNRRGFLGLLAAAAAVPLVPVPELDVGRRIFLPPRGGWMAGGLLGRYSGFSSSDMLLETGNVLLTPAEVARDALRIFNIVAEFHADIDREFDADFARVTLRTANRIRIGDRITIEGVS